MKKIIALLTLTASLLCTTAKADPTIHIVDLNGLYTNSAGHVVTGELARVAFSNVNNNFILVWSIVSNGITGIELTNTTTLSAGSSATATIVGYTSHTALIQLGIPQGLPGTNWITVFDPTNSILSSRKIVTYQTNNITWGTSNFLATVGGLSDWDVNFGMLSPGGAFSPPTNVFGQINGSYDGGATWFNITNGFKTTNTISVSAIGAGGGLGNATLYTIDHFELLGRTNYLYGQSIQIDNPRNLADPATKQYVDNEVGKLKNSYFLQSVDSNTVHYAYYGGGQTMQFDLWYQFIYIPISNLALDGTTGTNVLMDIYQTNLTTFTIQSSTNLNLGSAGFTTFTNYTISTNSGVVTFTIPIYSSEPQRFWRAISDAKQGVEAYKPVYMHAGGIQYRTNPWTALEITNSGGFAPWLSNFTQVYISINSNNVIYNKLSTQ